MFGAGGSTAYAAHLGGTFFGVSTALLLLSTGILKSTDLDLLYLMKQRRRRAEMRSAAADRISARRRRCFIRYRRSRSVLLRMPVDSRRSAVETPKKVPPRCAA